jgi:hypothetical protein
MYFTYNGYYFKLKALRDYQYLSAEEYSTFQWKIVKNLYTYLKSQNKLQLYNELTAISIKQQNNLIMSAISMPSPYLSIYKEC